MVASRASIKALKQQQGLVLLVLVIIIVLAFTSYTFSEISLSKIKGDRDKQTLVNLKKAKQALIDYAITYSDRVAGNDYGILPNPETSDISGTDGNMGPTVGAKYVNVIEWLPWRSLDMPTLKDDSDSCLFYAVSGIYKTAARADMVNEDTTGMFRIRNSGGAIVQGGSEENQVVALVIAPGPALTGQTRNPTELLSSCGRDYGNVPAYLEGNGAYNNGVLIGTADEVDDFIHATSTSSTEATPYNDRFLTIKREEIWDAIVSRDDFKLKMENLTRGLAMCLAGYANLTDNTSRRLPWPAATDLGFGTYDRKDFRANSNYDDDGSLSGGYSGRFPFNIGDSNDAINAGALIEDELFEIGGLCDNIDLGGGVIVDLKTTTSEYRKLWNNWKDHFFYVLSQDYEPDNTGASKCNGGGAKCIKVELNTSGVENEYAAAVIFSGSRLPGFTRNDKTVLSEYLEDGKTSVFVNEAADKQGDKKYDYTDPQTAAENDIMYCIEDINNLTADLTVIECI
jgi:hypothetical protein